MNTKGKENNCEITSVAKIKNGELEESFQLRNIEIIVYACMLWIN